MTQINQLAELRRETELALRRPLADFELRALEDLLTGRNEPASTSARLSRRLSRDALLRR